MEEILGHCGFRCDLCAVSGDDLAAKQMIIDGWKKFFGMEGFTVEQAQCGGCFEGTGLAEKCPVRICADEKGVENCAHCDAFMCEKLEPYMGSKEEFMERFDNVSETEYRICLLPFESRSRLMKIRESLGK